MKKRTLNIEQVYRRRKYFPNNIIESRRRIMFIINTSILSTDKGISIRRISNCLKSYIRRYDIYKIYIRIRI